MLLIIREISWSFNENHIEINDFHIESMNSYRIHV